MADIAKILAQVLLDSRTAVQSWKAFGDAGVKEFGRLGSAAKQATQQVNSSLNQMRDRFQAVGAEAQRLGQATRRVGQTMSVAITAPLVLLGRSGVRAFEAQEQAVNRLDAALANSGDTVKVTRAEMIAYAETTQESFGIADEQIIDMQATLLKFQNVTGDIFREAQQVIVDYAQQTGTDLSGAAQQIGKALDDPVRGMLLLRRAGVTLSQEQEDLIKSLQATGDALGAQGVLLDALNAKFRGSAARIAASETGELRVAMVGLNEALERLGEILLPIITRVVQGVSAIAEAFLRLPETVQQAIVSFGIFIAAVGPFLVFLGLAMQGFGGLLLAVSRVGPALGLLIGSITRFGQAVVFIVRGVGLATLALGGVAAWPIIVGLALGAIVVLVVQYWDEIRQAIEDAISAAIEFVNDMWQEFVSSLQAGVDRAIRGLQRIISWAQKAWNWLQRVAKAAGSALGGGGSAPAGAGGGGFARGGQVRGRGGVDKIAAWLTDEEFVHRVAAVRKYGVGFMQSVNNLSFPKRFAMGYAAGGLVHRPGMAMSTLGLGSIGGGGGRDLTLVIGDRTFTGMTASDDAAGALLKFARTSKVISTGAKPNWVR